MPGNGTMPARPSTPMTPGTTMPTRPTTPVLPATPGTTFPGNGTGTPPRPSSPMTPPNVFPGNTSPGPGSTMPRTQNHSHTAGSSREDYDFNGFPAYNPNGIYMSDVAPYHIPYAVPMMPLYGYDNCEDADKDWDYMRQMFPVAAKKILSEVEDECDKLEYDGSCMFDEYPDRVYLGRIVDKIYARCSYLEEELTKEHLSTCGDNNEDDDKYLKANQYDCRCRDNRPGCCQRNWMRDFIEVLLFNEMLNRRRRYRGRKRWF
ncbi:hypothetical protein HNQ54_001540 [Anaerocolumna cellulosilytica]|nr:hypothetical protein [Anaerocolumna cellulosilytica]